ncbi:ABC transporter substrate-binding protein [Alkalihalobacillus sp. BA299]|uniref:ABC transporter substrate-binding protein n=1 Tax=Alkalihalobacillus sp. BA299 TaxID=2815938 RepID=UPI001ADD5E09|nr:ABC transporter substrate-binding protein [Alkalihalobacillus sp. BA299]
MKKGKQWLLACLLFGLMLFVAACGNTPSTSEPAENNNDQELAPEVSEGEKVVTIGYTGPLSGPAAFYGENTVSGLRMAADEINETGFEIDGQTYKINLVTLDDKYAPNESGTNARRLKQEHDTPIIFVPHSGGVFATQVFNEQEEFLIAAYTSEPTILEQDNELTLRIPPAYTAYPETFTKYSQERFGKKLALLPTATQYGKDWTEALLPVWESHGGEVVFKGEVDFSKDTDFFTIVTNALAEKPDVIFVGGPSQPTALIIKQARELGFEGGFMVMDQAKLEEMAPILEGYEMLEGAIGALPIIDSDAGGASDFVSKYEAEFGRIPTAEGAFNYQALYVLVEAMKAAGTVEDAHAIMAKVDQGIQQLPDDKMVWHLTGLDGQGFDWLPSIGYVENGEVVLISE